MAKKPSFNSHLGTYVLAIPIILFYALALTGCISNSPGVPNLYLVKIQGNGTLLPSDLEIRVGYFGLCIGNSSTLTCQSTLGKSANLLSAGDAKVRAAIGLGLVLQNKILLWLLAASGVLFFFGFFVVLLLGFELKRPSTGTRSDLRRRLLSRFCTVVAWTSTTLAFASAVGITQATSALQYLTTAFPVMVAIDRGKYNVVLQWLIGAFSFLFTYGVSMMYDGAVTPPDSKFPPAQF